VYFVNIPHAYVNSQPGGVQQAVPDNIIDEIIQVMHSPNGILRIDVGKDLLGAVRASGLPIDGALLQAMQAHREGSQAFPTVTAGLQHHP
jgi:hypothetical protein